jgi:hypothetical protein
MRVVMWPAGRLLTCPQQPTIKNGARLDRIAPGNDTLLLTGFRGDGLALKMVMDCNQKFVFVPSQTIGGSSFSGTGTIELVYVNPPAKPVFN